MEEQNKIEYTLNSPWLNLLALYLINPRVISAVFLQKFSLFSELLFFLFLSGKVGFFHLFFFSHKAIKKVIHTHCLLLLLDISRIQGNQKVLL